MSRWDEYGDSAPKIKTEQKEDTWQPIGALVLQDIERIVGKLTEGQGDDDAIQPRV
jgi:hypothetical protein